MNDTFQKLFDGYCKNQNLDPTTISFTLDGEELDLQATPEDEDFKTLSDKQAAIAHCPSSNLFLGSGLFDLRKAKCGAHPVHVGLGTDLGAGTSFSQLQSLGDE